MPSDSSTYASLSHPRVARVERAIFSVGFAPDCMTHQCRCQDEGGRKLLDACCQHGCDVDLFERDAIRARAAAIAAVMSPEWRDPERWFDESVAEPDPEAPSGTVIRTAMTSPGEAGGCVFLQHDRRGCALHRAAIEHNFAPEEIKPVVCRLYPLSYGEGDLCLSDDFPRYSCAGAGGPTVYRLLRPVIADVFGPELVPLLDRVERQERRKHSRERLRVIEA